MKKTAQILFTAVAAFAIASMTSSCQTNAKGCCGGCKKEECSSCSKCDKKCTKCEGECSCSS